MGWIQVETRDGVTAFRPGDEIEATVRWQLDAPPRSLEARLFWYTEGKGDQDVGIVESLPLEGPVAEGHRGIRFRLPAGPFSFSGKLISLLWAIEAVAEPGGAVGRLELVVSPTGQEIRLPMAPADPEHASP
jgi:hypothetical protein